ncbi:MAG: hypothetical protein K2X39_10600 [Silvanigrellaceae bacterium]|nr:hypothetical protein [Silvanigrellaceae bacterium]
MLIDKDTQEIIKFFFKYKIIQVNLNEPFKLSSGKTSPVYIDHRYIFSFPQLRKKIIEKWSELIKNSIQDFSSRPLVFAGTATAGIAPAYALAEKCDAGFVYVRGKSKSHGLKSCIEGYFAPNSVFVVVDDMVTTGGSILNAVEKIQELSGQVILATSISRHDLKNTNYRFSQNALPLKSLFKTTDIFDAAYGMNLIDGKEMRAIMEWITQLGEHTEIY